MSDILLSIKPEYVSKIFDGSKRYEFRRKCCKEEISKIVIYATHPIMKIVGEIEINQILKESPAQLWEKTKEYAGISEEDFFNYFEGCSEAYGYEVKTVKKYKRERELVEYGIRVAPQSFIYL